MRSESENERESVRTDDGQDGAPNKTQRVLRFWVVAFALILFFSCNVALLAKLDFKQNSMVFKLP